MQQLNPMIVDTDAAFDDFIAMYSLKESATATTGNIQFVSTVAGIQNQPSRSIAFLQKHFPQTIVTTGADGPSNQSVAEWLIAYRENLNSFMDKEGGPAIVSKKLKGTKKGDDDTETILNDFLKKQKNNSTDILCIGPLTNLAKWVSSTTTGPLLQQKVKDIWIMGGNIPQTTLPPKDSTLCKETKVEPEYNFAQDPMAANIALSSPLIAEKIYILPAETCIDVPITNEKWAKILSLIKSRTGLISKILRADADYGHFKYDPLCAFSYAHPHKFQSKQIAVEVNSSTGLVSVAEKKLGDDAQTIKFITYVDHDGEDGFFHGCASWLKMNQLQGD
eukprot:CAMPEP_0185733978 /NCGR_PEP_ID=MMETSP1171-20130828/21045_1 /TAXON_ID=374046 /ORGANISM="Helicotheca tamensis, Strain CCMP826" /LENGTH=333 /DNA_ID=CAMNT_0028403847 /DNA_START=97 /DNA_END=1096 /DNA_ORIENTATION=-